MDNTSDASASSSIKEWLVVELQKERAAVMQLLGSRHDMLMQSLNTVHEGAQLSSAHECAQLSKVVKQGSSTNRPSGRASKFSQKSSTMLFGQKKVLAPSELDEQRMKMFKMPGSVKDLVENTLFEIVLTTAIILSGLLTALKLHYESFDMAIAVNMTMPTAMGPVIPEASEVMWPGIHEMLAFWNYFFGALFVLEVFLKIVAYELRFFCCGWNVFDALVVFFWLYDEAQPGELLVNPMLMRLARLARVLRLFRVMKSLRGLDALKLIITSISGSFSILFWSFVVLFVQMMLVGMIFAFTLQVDMLNPHLALEKRQEIYTYFGSFSRAMLTMLEVTLGNWLPVTRMLSEAVGEHWALILVCYNISVGFAVVTVIRGVFMRETFKVASTDDDLMVLEKQAQNKHFSTKMRNFINRADASGSGSVSKQEFEAVVGDANTSAWLAAMDLRIPEADRDRVWQVIDFNHDGHLDAEELITGFGRMKGPAQALDIIFLGNAVKDVQQCLEGLRSELATLQSAPPEPQQEEKDVGMMLVSKPGSPGYPSTAGYRRDRQGQAGCQLTHPATPDSMVCCPGNAADCSIMVADDACDHACPKLQQTDETQGETQIMLTHRTSL